MRVEVIVVDNASTDGSQRMVAEEFPEAILLKNSSNLGFSKANNQAISIANGRYIFLLNSDARLYRDALPRLVEFMEQNPQVGICGPRVVNEDGTLQVRSKGRYPTIMTAIGHFFLPLSKQYRKDGLIAFYESRDWQENRQMDWVSGCALLVRRDAVEDVGLLDAEVFMYCEDVDWCYRMKSVGWQISYVPSAVVMHHMGKSMEKQTGRVVGAHKSGLVAFYTKYNGFFKSAVFRAVLWSGYGTQVLRWLAEPARRQRMDKIRRLWPWHRLEQKK